MAAMKERKRIEERAAAWVAREDRAALNVDELSARDAWLREDPRHQGAYARARAVFVQTQRMRALSPDLLAPVPPRRIRSNVRALLAMAAVLALLVMGSRLDLLIPGKVHATQIGEIASVALPDGSELTLNSDSRVVVRFNDAQRHVELRQGEVLFDVAKDSSRPFVVVVDDARVVAVGTSFSVQRERDKALRVVVSEGVVDVSGPAPGAVPVRVPASFEVFARPGREVRIEPLAAEAVERKLAWRDGMISFNGDTLAEAAAEFSRYSDMRILIDDPEVAHRRVVGLYSSSDPAGFASTVAHSLGLEVELGNGGIYLRKETASEQRP